MPNIIGGFGDTYRGERIGHLKSDFSLALMTCVKCLECLGFRCLSTVQLLANWWKFWLIQKIWEYCQHLQSDFTIYLGWSCTMNHSYIEAIFESLCRAVGFEDTCWVLVLWARERLTDAGALHKRWFIFC